MVLVRHCSDSRFVYNLGLEQRKFYRSDRVTKINTATQMRELTEARKSFSWLAEGSSSVQQAALRDLDRAFQNWWKNPGHFSHPTWRKAGLNEGFCVRDLSVRKLNRKWGEVLVPKAGWVRFRLSRPWAEIEASIAEPKRISKYPDSAVRPGGAGDLSAKRGGERDALRPLASLLVGRTL